MPFLSEHFSHVITSVEEGARGTFKYKCNDNTYIEVTQGGSSPIQYRPKHTEMFCQDLFEILQKTNLDITYDEEYSTFNIFGLDIIVKCFDNCRSETDATNYIENNQKNGTSYCGCIFPIPILSRYNSISANMGDAGPIHLYGNNYNVTSNIASYGLESNTTSYYANSRASIFTTESFLNLDYSINVYYNDNFLIITYISSRGYEYPLLTIIKGKTKENLTIVGVTIASNFWQSETYWNFTVIEKIDTFQYTDYMRHSTQYSFLEGGQGNHGPFNEVMYPSNTYIKRLAQDNTINNVFLNALTAYGQMVEFDNIYDVSRIHNNDVTIPDQIFCGKTYNIGNDIYYCPGNYPASFKNYPNTVYTSNKTGPTDYRTIKMLFKL